MHMKIRKTTEMNSIFEIKFTCPSCGKNRSLFRSIPRTCEECGNEIPNLFAMLYDIKARKRWHTSRKE
jgi:uncharacterized protein (DUF983 family)